MRTILAAVLLAAAIHPVHGVGPHPHTPWAPGGPDAPSVSGLARLFERGPFLKDENGDGRIDEITARLVLPDAPEPDEMAGASAVAARLGFETSGLSFPIVLSAAEARGRGASSLILIGGTNPLLPPSIKRRLEALGPSSGLVAFANDMLVIAGKTPSGTRAAAEAFASRAPYVWEVIGRDAGETYEKLAADLASFLREKGIPVAGVSVDEVVFEKDRPEAVLLRLRAKVPRAAAGREALEALADAHRHGLDTDKLSISSAANIEFSFDDGSRVEEARIERVGAPLRILSPPRDRLVPPPETGEGVPRSPERPVPFDLSTLYTRTGLLGDDDRDQIPDGTETLLVLAPENLALWGTPHLAARLGLESTGVSFPIAKLDSEIKDSLEERVPLLLLGNGRQARELERLGKRRAPRPPPGTGVIEVVPRAFGDFAAVILTGGDREGAEAAADYLARRAPYVWTARRGALTLDDVEDAVSALLEGRTAAGQAALARARLEEVLTGLEGKEVERLEARLTLEEDSQELQRFLSTEMSRRFPGARVKVSLTKRRGPVPVFKDEPVLEWEVDGFWRAFREKALPRITAGRTVSVELRVSESPELRRALESEIRGEIERTGAKAENVRVLSAYKQGLSWLTESVAPRLPRDSVRGLEVSFKPFPVDPGKKWRFYGEPARWLNELYPVDDVLARDLGLPLSAIRFARAEGGEATYTVKALDGSGRVTFHDSFSPATYERPYLDAFPNRTGVTVTTGWIRVVSDGEALLNERLPTDFDRIWDFYQGTTLAKVYDHVKRTTGGKPTQEKQPFFHTLELELHASEPDYALGIDQELISSLESIHDDFYFDTLDFFNEVIEDAEGKPVPSRTGAPGNVLPRIHPERRGQAPSFTATYLENAGREPKLVVEYQERGGPTRTETRELQPVKLLRPAAEIAHVRAGADALAGVELRVELEKPEALPRVVDILDNLARLQRASVFPHALGFSGLKELTIRVQSAGTTLARSFATIPAPVDAPTPSPYTRGRLVTWDHVIGPDESERIAATLGTVPGVRTYVAGKSYQGRPVSVMEIALPATAETASQAKMSAWKPVLSIMGRQHANEVSSTSHVLRLAELLATDSQYRRYLEKMNFVIQPVVNPDGAALAYELQKLTPLHCLHAGRYSALGPDVPTEARKPDTLLTEALVLNKVYNTWLPDVQLNPHGYPTHEWVQTFANYNPNGFRSYWIPRGWWTSIASVDDPRYPLHREAALALRDGIARELTRDPEARATNLRIQDRYQRWTSRFQPHVYNLEIHDDTAIYFTRRSGAAPRPDARAGITVFFGMTEAMDETAQSESLDLAARMGFSYLMASIRFLETAEYTLYRLEEERQGKVRLSVTRPRPVRPKAGAGER